MNNAVLIDTECFVPLRGAVNFNYYKALHRISEMIQKGPSKGFPKICLCSRRTKSEVELLAHILGFPHSLAIIENGALLLDLTSGETLSSPQLTSKAETLYSIYRRNIPKILKKYKGLSLCSGYAACITLERIPESVLFIEELCKGIRKELLSYKWKIRVTHTERTITIAPSGIDKSSGVEYWALCREINLQNSLSIGFSKGDVSFIKQFGMMGCPNNANQELKRFVKEKRGKVSSLSSTEGVANIIEYYLCCLQ